MTLKSYIMAELEEIKREFLDALEGLDDDTIGRFSPKGHWPIAWIVQHCCENYDKWLYKSLTGKYCLQHDLFITARPIQPPDPEAKYPTIDTLRKRIDKVLSSIIEEMKKLKDEDLDNKLHGEESIVLGCYRVINHTNSHLRNIWFILGELGVDRWSEQKLVFPSA
ncbi:MAG: hypothetical protein DRP87_01725 [Spirochaetes bacterium]|mgnify:CR=1 FL=1|nr:MAG: hypothetical protein DRP87_01725 [Spirochaetota bacterium]